MNYAQKHLIRAIEALKAARKLRKAADRVQRQIWHEQQSAVLTLATTSGQTATITLPLSDADCHKLAREAADEVASEALSRQVGAEKEVTYWAREVVLMADKKAAASAEYYAPAEAAAETSQPQPAMPAPAPEPSPEATDAAPWAAVFIAALNHGATLQAAAYKAGIPYLEVFEYMVSNADFRAEFNAALLSQRPPQGA